MALNEGSVSLTNEEVEARSNKDFSNKTTRVLRFKANQTVRVHFPSMEVMLRRRHYNSKKKKYYRCLDHLGYCPVCVAATDKVQGCKRASETFGANIFVYDTNPDGSVKQPLNAEVYFWAFGSEKFAAIRQIIKEWGPVDQLDLSISCTDEDFQKVTISLCKDCHFLLADDSFRAAMQKKFEEDKYPLDKFLCKELNIVEMAREFELDENRYVPAAIFQQMSGGGNAAQQAASVGQTPPPVQNYQAPPTPVPNTTPPTQATAGYTPPAPDEASFESLENLGTLL